MIKSPGIIALVLAAGASTACNSEDAPSDGGPSGGCNVDYSRLASHRTVAFRADVMPILNGSCGLSSSCHDSNRPEAELVLGDPCQRNDAGTCAPLGEAAISAIHANLLEASRTAPAVKRVAPTKPAESFVLDKMADIQDTLGYACTPQDPGVQGCGTGMPPGDPLCAQPDGQARFDVVAAWVLQGAPNN